MHIVAVGGSDAGISAALRAREVDPSAEVTVVVADAFPNFSICGIPTTSPGTSLTGATWYIGPEMAEALSARGLAVTAGGRRAFADSLGTQVVKVFDQAAARTGLRDHEAVAAGTGRLRSPSGSTSPPPRSSTA